MHIGPFEVELDYISHLRINFLIDPTYALYKRALEAHEFVYQIDTGL
jgi:hypothetical protein